MSIRSQDEYIDKINDTLLKTDFVHNKAMYRLAGWNTNRDQANKGNVEYTPEQVIVDNNYNTSKTLYAVWVERDSTVSYGKLSITANNISYNQNQTTLTWQIEETYTYDNGVIKSKKTLTGTSTFVTGTNGCETGKEEIATNARTITVSYTHETTGQTATTKITQTGYTPIFKIQYVNDSYRGKIECYQTVNGKTTQLTPSVSNGISTIQSTNKTFTLKAVPSSTSTQKWVAKKGCAYYSQPEKWTLHVNRSGCGSWQTITNDFYELNQWSGGSITGNTNTSVNVNGTVLNVQTYSASFKVKPLLTNAVIGTWRKDWTTYVTKYRTETKTAYTYSWVRTCGHDVGKNHWCHVGWSGHGYYKATPYTYIQTTSYQEPIYHTNKYKSIVKQEFSAPYTFTIPETGILTIKGKYGIDVYGCTCNRTGGFKLLKYSSSQNSMDDFMSFSSTLNSTDKEFSARFNVVKGEQYQFESPFSSTLAHIAIYVEEMKLEETSEKIETQTSGTEKFSNDIVIIDDLPEPEMIGDKTTIEKYNNDLTALQNDIDRKTAINKLFDNASSKDDYSEEVVKAGKFYRDGKYRDHDGYPQKTTTLSVDKQSVVQIYLGAGSGWGYVRQLQISDASNNKVLKTITATGTTWGGDIGQLTAISCRVYLPPSKKIKIFAQWTRVDTQHFGVDLNIKGVKFDKL